MEKVNVKGRSIVRILYNPQGFDKLPYGVYHFRVQVLVPHRIVSLPYEDGDLFLFTDSTETVIGIHRSEGTLGLTRFLKRYGGEELISYTRWFSSDMVGVSEKQEILKEVEEIAWTHSNYYQSIRPVTFLEKPLTEILRMQSISSNDVRYCEKFGLLRYLRGHRIPAGARVIEGRHVKIPNEVGRVLAECPELYPDIYRRHPETFSEHPLR